MKTLIELYDERPVENILATEVFRPEKTVFLCTADIAQNKRIKENIRSYLRHRGVNTEPVFIESSLYDTEKIKNQLIKTANEYPDCVLDITGGTDAGLFAGGLTCGEYDLPVFTYSRRKNRFFNILGAPFAEGLECDIKYSVNDYFMMAGGELKKGRVNNDILADYTEMTEKLFAIYLKNRKTWNKAIEFIRSSSQRAQNTHSLDVDSPFTVKGNRGKIECPVSFMHELEKDGFISSLKTENGVSVSFTFGDENIMTWLRDVGSVLELYVSKLCSDCGIFNDVVMSAVVDWDKGIKRDKVTNEIDVMAMYGVFPLFISCKTCDISTEALNELAILRDRFGSGIAKAAIVTTKTCRSITRHRADELDITVIDIEDIKSARIKDIIVSLMKNIK